MNKIKFLYIILYTVVLGTSCSKESIDNNPLIDDVWKEIEAEYISNQILLGLASDRIVYPVPWTEEVEKTFEILDETVSSMSTCGLLDSYLSYPPLVLGPWCTICSNSYTQGARNFWAILAGDKVVTELFTRGDCIRVITERYANMIQSKNVFYYDNDDKDFHDCQGVLKCFEMLIASDSFLEKLSEHEMKCFMVMALKMLEVRNENMDVLGTPHEIRHIMANIMLVSKFMPFVAEFEAIVPKDILWGYTICSYTDNSGIGIVEKYARQYLINFKF